LSFWEFGACRVEETPVVKVGVVGGIGYAGVELLRLLAAHRAVEVTAMQDMNLMAAFPGTPALDQLAIVP
jgi:N-acetyl-gamma-glutamylphosphate reductase